MNPKRKVFVFPCGSEIGLEINRSLSYSTFFELIGGSSVDDHGRFAYGQHLNGLPFIDDPVLLLHLKEIISSYQIELIIPALDSVVVQFARWADLGELEPARLVTSALQACLTTRSKGATYEYFEGIIPTPKRYDSVNTIDRYPVFLKPDVGQGSKGTYKATCEAHVSYHLARDPSLLILEYLPGREYTIDCFSDRHGQLRFVGARTRQRIAGGISVNALAAEDPRFQTLADKIHTHLELRGQWFFQVKERQDGELVLMEIAPRASGTCGFQRNLGVNLPLLSLHDAIGHDVEILKNPYTLEMDRALASRYTIDFDFDSIFVDLDDTLVIDGQVNFRLMAILYRFKSESKKLHLVTRHRARYQEESEILLERYDIPKSLFAQIIDVTNDQKKSTFITNAASIFVDDSFSERSEVAKACGIPVFDINQAIEVFGDYH